VKKLTAAFLALVFVAGCSHTPRATPTGLPPSAFWADQARRADETKRIIGKMFLSHKGKKQSVSGKGRLLTQLPSHARLEMRDPLGRVAFLAVLEGTRFTAYYPTQKRAYVGEESGRTYFRNSMGLEVGFDELQRLVLGLLPDRAGKGPFPAWTWDEEKGAYRGDLKRGEVTWRVFVDGKTAAVRELSIESPAETVTVKYSNYEPCCGSLVVGESQVALAAVVQVGMDRAATSVEWEWGDIEKIEKPHPAESFRIPLAADVQKTSFK